MTTDRLTVTGVSKTFGHARALINVDLNIRPREVHAVVGHNGSGKSSLVKLLAGYHQPDPGARAEVDGIPFDLGSATAATAAGLRFVHQDLGLIDTLDAVDNLHVGRAYPLRLKARIDWPAARQRAKDDLHALGFAFDVSAPVGTLSSTQRTAVAVARAVSYREGGRVLVLDEPTAALPERDIETLLELVRTLQRQAWGILYISHHLEEVFAVADRVTVLRDGERICTERTANLNEPELVELMVGHAISAAARMSRPVSRSEPVLTLSRISAQVLRDVTFAVRPGEVVGVTGVDGSGREELAAAIFGGVPHVGDVVVDGKKLPSLRPDIAAARGVGLVPADRAAQATLPRLPVLDNLQVASWKTKLLGLWANEAAAREETHAWLERLSVRPPRADVPIDTLSGGNQQKIILARWLRTSPKVLLLDEPTKGVDVAAVAEIWKLVDEAARDQTAVVVCASDTAELAANCDRVLVLRRGRVAACLEGDDLNVGRLDSLAISDRTGAAE